jgi:Flp pilus assembly protein TadG
MIQRPIIDWISKRLWAIVRDKRASTAVEFAMAAPAIFLFMFGIIETGYALWMQNALDYSTAAAARCASLNGNDCKALGNTSQVTTYAANESGASLGSAAFTYTTGAGTTCGGCQVSGSYAISLDIPWSSLTVNLASRACFNPPPNQNCAS